MWRTLRTPPWTLVIYFFCSALAHAQGTSPGATQPGDRIQRGPCRFVISAAGAISTNGCTVPWPSASAADGELNTKLGAGIPQTALENIIAAAAGAPVTVAISGNVGLSSLVIPANISLSFSATGKITVSGGTVTIRGPVGVMGGDRQIFDANGRYFSFAGNGAVTSLNVKWFGATGDGTTDDTAAIQTAISAIAPNAGTKAVFFPHPAVYYKITAPLFSTTENLALIGEAAKDGRTVELHGNGVYAPLLALGRAGSTTAIASATSAANSITIGANNWINLRDLGVSLDGFISLTAETFATWSAATCGVDNYCQLFGSTGVTSNNYFSAAASSKAFFIGVDGAKKVIGYLTTSDGTYTLGPSAPLSFDPTVWTHFALSYNGTTARLFVNGTQVASTAATGTVRQQPLEDIIIGKIPQHSPETGTAQYAQNGLYLCPRLTLAARYTSDFTPNAATACTDTTVNDLVKLTALTTRGTLIAAKVGANAGTTQYVMPRSSTDANYTNTITISNLFLNNIGGVGLLTQNCPYLTLDNVTANGNTGAWFTGQKFLSRIRNLRATSSGTSDARAGVVFSGPPGAGSSWDGGDVEGYQIGVASADGVQQYNNLYINTFTETRIPLYLLQGNALFNNLWIDDETAPSSARPALIYATGFQNLTFNGGSITGTYGNPPALVIDYPQSYARLSITGGRFTVPASNTSIIGFTSGAGQAVPHATITEAIKLSDFFTASPVPWVAAADKAKIDFALPSLALAATNTAAGTTGAQTIDKPAGTVNFAAGAASLVVTNSLVSTTSLIFAQAQKKDSTCEVMAIVPAAGSFTIVMNAPCTAETAVAFQVIN